LDSRVLFMQKSTRARAGLALAAYQQKYDIPNEQMAKQIGNRWWHPINDQGWHHAGWKNPNQTFGLAYPGACASEAAPYERLMPSRLIQTNQIGQSPPSLALAELPFSGPATQVAQMSHLKTMSA
jgi:hypothetical protein